MGAVALYYLQILPAVREAARACGYAVGIHGSMERDFDLIAAPWIDEAKPAEELVEAIRVAVSGEILPSYRLNDDRNHNPSDKPHGRRAWSILLGGELKYAGVKAYIDLSVMPRRA